MPNQPKFSWKTVLIGLYSWPPGKDSWRHIVESKGKIVAKCAAASIAVLGIVIGLIVWMHLHGPSGSQTNSISGNSAPVIVGNNITDNNSGIRDSTLRSVLNLKAVELPEQVQAEYPHGCLILGLENGKVKYDSRLKGIQFDADWDNATISIDNGTFVLSLPRIKIISGGVHKEYGFSVVFIPLSEHEPVLRWSKINGLSLWCEVLDSSRKIFIIGCK